MVIPEEEDEPDAAAAENNPENTWVRIPPTRSDMSRNDTQYVVLPGGWEERRADRWVEAGERGWDVPSS
eukprot:2485247-Rhodomonas_salina.4